jgi:hypothetical protein
MEIALLVVAALVVLFAITWTVRRHGEAQLPAAGWQRTDEVFIDPTTNRKMRVWIDPQDGSRRYVPES